MKQIAIKGGLLSKAEAMAYRQTLEEDTILVSVMSPTGLPVTPLCYISVGKELLRTIETALDDPNHFYSIDPINVREPSVYDVEQATDLFAPTVQTIDEIVEEVDVAEPVTELESVLNPESLETIEIDIPKEPEATPRPTRKKKEKANG